MFSINLHHHYWKLGDGRLWSSKAMGWVSDQAPEYLAWTAEGKEPSMAPDQQGIMSEQGLRDTLVFYDLPLGVLMTEEENTQARILEIKLAMEALDAKYLPPRTVTDMVLGVPEALERKRLHEEAVAPLRQELKALQGVEADQGAVTCA